jgi:hypothetical protein
LHGAWLLWRCRMLIPSAGMTRIRFDGSAALPPLSLV